MRQFQQVVARRGHHVYTASAVYLKVDKAGKKIVADACRRAMPADRIDTAAKRDRAWGEVRMGKRVDGEAGQGISVVAPYQC